MSKHRIGGDLQIRWRIIDESGAPYDLTAMNIRIELLDVFKRKREITDFSIEEKSRITFTFRGTEQTTAGSYTMIAWLNKGLEGQYPVDACNAFELVPCIHQGTDMGAGGFTTEYVDQTSTIQIGVQGKSAYASWLSTGHQGTEADFIAWLQQPAKEAAKIAQEYNDHQPIVGTNGNWWVWDAASDAYIDTNHPSRGDVCYPTFSVNDDMEVVIHKPAALPDGMFRLEDGDLIMTV